MANANALQIQLAWWVVYSKKIGPNTPLSQAMMILKNAGHWALVEAFAGPVMAGFNATHGAEATIRHMFKKNRKLKDLYDTGLWGEATPEETKSAGPLEKASITQGEWDDMVSRLKQVEDLLGTLYANQKV